MTSHTSNLSSMKLTVCLCLLFFIAIEAAPKPCPPWNTCPPPNSWYSRSAAGPEPTYFPPPWYSRSAARLATLYPTRPWYSRSGGETGKEFDLSVIAQMFPGAGSALGQIFQDSLASGSLQDGINQILG